MRQNCIPQWARLRDLKQIDIARTTGATKSLVSHWFKGTTPGPVYQAMLARLFDCTPDDLFRHPDEAWISDFLAGRSPEEIARIKQVLEMTFPKC